MSDQSKLFRLRKSITRSFPFMKDVSEELIIVMIGSVPLIGPSLVINRKVLDRLSAIFESDDEIQRDISKVVRNMQETEEIMVRLKMHIESRKNDLEQTFEDYKRFKELAEVEREKARPILSELHREGNKGIYWGVLSSLAMVIIGIILEHFLRIWFPGFPF